MLLPLRPPADDREIFRLANQMAAGMIAAARLGMVTTPPGPPHASEAREMFSTFLAARGPLDDAEELMHAMQANVTDLMSVLDKSFAIFSKCVSMMTVFGIFREAEK